MNGGSDTRLPQFATDPEAALESYRILGYHIEEDIWTPLECEALVRAAQNFPLPKDGVFAPLMQPHRQDSIFLLALRNAKIVGIMEKLVSGRVSGLQSEFFFSGPGTPGFAKHQDNRSLEAKPDSFASAWSALQHITPEVGGLVGYPGTHNEPILPTVKTGRAPDRDQDPNAYGEEAVLPACYEPLDLVVPAGSVVFMHSHFVHASHQNRSSGFRYALLLTYIRSGEPFRPGFTAQRAEVNVY
jgi:ectoine hydroxylase-related dioxygenase (phytanoyl-CoA dioxygenase family)